MRCNVLFFAHTAELAGTRAVTLELHDGATVNEALDALVQQSPALSSMRQRIACAVNERYVTSAHVLTDSDTLALIPPVSGG